MVAVSPTLTITRDEVRRIETPPATASYGPVPYESLLNIMDAKAHEVLPDDYNLHTTQYRIADRGDRFMATHVWKRTALDEMGISFFTMASHNKKIPIKFLFGEGNISACFNGCIFGARDNTVTVRKHTTHVMRDIPIAAQRASEGVWERFGKLQEDMEQFKRKPFDDGEMFKFTGFLLGRGAIGPKMFNPIIKEWRNPTRDAFQPRNMWSAYNAVTEVLKASPLQHNLNRHSDVHDAALAY